MWTRKAPAVIALLGMALLPSSACSGGGSAPGSGTDAGTPKRGGDLVIARNEETQTLNPTRMFHNEDIWLSEQLYQTLFFATAKGDKVEPMLAKSYQVADNKRRWTFHLRHDVKFSNGRPMTSADVKFSLEQVMGKGSLHADIDASISEVKSPGKWTVVVRTKYPWAPLLADLSMFANAIVPANYAGKSKKNFYRHPIGTGPFKLDEWKKGQKLRVTRNPYYWVKGRPYLNSVTWTTVADANTRGIQVQGSQADIGEFPPWSSIAKLKSAPNVSVKLFPSSRTDFLALNNKRKPFGDVHVRRAISYALDRGAMVKAALFGKGKVATSFLTPALWAHVDAGAGEHRMSKAKAEMAKSSKPNGFSTTLTVGTGDETLLTVAQLIQQQLKAIGIKVKIRRSSNASTEHETFNYDMTFTYDTTDIIDPDELVKFAVVGSFGAHSLWTGYNNAKVNRLSTRAAHIFNRAKRKKLYATVQRVVTKQAPLIPLYNSPFAYVQSNQVHGFTVYSVGYYPLEDVWLDNA